MNYKEYKEKQLQNTTIKKEYDSLQQEYNNIQTEINKKTKLTIYGRNALKLMENHRGGKL